MLMLMRMHCLALRSKDVTSMTSLRPMHPSLILLQRQALLLHLLHLDPQYKPVKERLERQAKKPRNGQLPCFGSGSVLNQNLSAPPMYAAHQAEEELLAITSKDKSAQSPVNGRMPPRAPAQASKSSSNSADAPPCVQARNASHQS